MAEYQHILNPPPPHTHTHTSTPEEDQGKLPLPHTTIPFCDPPDILSYTTAEPGDTVPSAGLENRDHLCITAATSSLVLPTEWCVSLHVEPGLKVTKVGMKT